MTSIWDVPVVTADGATTDLSEHRGKVVLIVNVASRCGLAPQYAELEELQRKYGERGFVVLGFPSNQFFQELGSNDAIAQYCSATWGISFPIFDKIRVNGRDRAPLYTELVKVKDELGRAGNIRWNFEKFLVLPNGEIRRFRPTTRPSDPAIVSVIEENLPS